MFRHHVWILAYRVLLLSAALFLYFTDQDKLDFTNIFPFHFGGLFLMVIWLTLIIGMLYRIVPNKNLAMGARKHYTCSFRAAVSDNPDDIRVVKKQLHKGAFLSAFAFILVNAALFYVLSRYQILTPATVMVVVLVYAVLDISFILFFCPFKILFMRNHCCTVCRIYNWDYVMMCMPLLLFPDAYSVSLLLVSFIVLLRWEMTIYKNPHFFTAKTNENLCCGQCEDRLCFLQKKIKFTKVPKTAYK